MKTRKINPVIQYLETQRGLDFSDSGAALISRGIEQRMRATGSNTETEYLQFLKNNPEESDLLVQSLTIAVSGFFRDPLVFECLSSIIFPYLVMEKIEKGDRQLRVWSAGCAAGEEPYSVAIALKEELRKRGPFEFDIFATDIDTRTLELAKKARYSPESLESIRYGYLKYFTAEGSAFLLKDEIKKDVHFSTYDLLDKKNFAPPESVFAGFDIVLCRNVLIYFSPPIQKKILEKLYRSLNDGGYLVLGEAEAPVEECQKYLKKVADCCHVYQKVKNLNGGLTHSSLYNGLLS